MLSFLSGCSPAGTDRVVHETGHRAFEDRTYASEPSAVLVGADGDDVVLLVDVGDRRYVGPLGLPPRELPREPGARPLFVGRVGAELVSADWSGTELVVRAGDAAAVREDLGARPLSFRRAASETTLLVAVATDAGAVRAYVSDGRALAPLPATDAPDGLAREVLVARVVGGRHAFAYRRGIPEDDRGSVHLVVGGRDFTHEALAELGMLERLELGDGVVTAVGSFEFARPMAFSFGLDGSLRSAVPLPLARAPRRAARAEVEADAAGVRLRLRDDATDLLDERTLPRRGGVLPPVVARVGERFVVAYTDGGVAPFRVRVVEVPAEAVGSSAPVGASGRPAPPRQ